MKLLWSLISSKRVREFFLMSRYRGESINTNLELGVIRESKRDFDILLKFNISRIILIRK